jgi:hypothetical protein
MKNIIISIITAMVLLMPAGAVNAQNVAGYSAQLITSNKVESDIKLKRDLHIKRLAIKKIMEKYDSPMEEAVDSFITTCVKYSLDCYLLPSIAILESTFGRFIWPDSYNPFGWGGGYIMFDDWSEGIETVGKGLRNNYINKGAESIEQIGRIYSESPTWSPRVRNIQMMFEKEEAKIQLYLEADNVKL